MTSGDALPATLTPKFIFDSPAQIDSFGSHDRVAKAVAQVVNERSDLKIVGLLGTWGSGKSTVVHLIEEELKKTDKPKGKETYFFTYDAWLHQNDPPRRSFLESFFEFIKSSDLPFDAKWSDDLAILSGKKAHITTKSTPIFTLAGKYIFFISLLFVALTQLFNPAGLKLLFGDANERYAQLTFQAVVLFLFLNLTFLLVVVPVCTALLKAYISLVSYLNKRFGWKFQVPASPPSLLTLWINKGIESNQSTTTKDPEPTTIEFQEKFKKILNGVGGKNRNFIFVIDNLDRLPEAEALSLWATIRSLFLGAGSNRNGKIAPTEALSIILPVDIDAITRMFAVSNDPQKTERLVQSFMDKTFDLVFNVPPPINSHWKHYLEDKLKFVFDGHISNDDVHLTGLLYEKWRSRKALESPTPREINKLVNFIASLSMQQRKHTISYASICYYAINHKNLSSNLLSEIKNEKDGIEHYATDWQKEIAALYFGCEPEDAVQLLVGRHIRTAIGDRSLEQFRDLANKVNGFGDVCRKVIESESQAEEVDQGFMLNASYLIRTLDLGQIGWVKESYRCLQNAFCKEATTYFVDENSPVSLEALLESCSDYRITEVHAAATQKMSKLNPGKIEKARFATLFYETAKVLLNSSIKRKYAMGEVHTPKEIELHLRIIGLSSENDSLLNAYKTTHTDDALVAEIANNLSSNKYADCLGNIVVALYSAQTKSTWESFAEQINTFTRSYDINHNNMEAVLFCAGYLSDRDPALSAIDNAIASLANDGILNNRFHEAALHGDKLPIAVNALATLLMRGGSVLTAPTGMTWDAFIQKQPNLIPSLNEALTKIGYTTILHQLADRVGNSNELAPLVQALMSFRLNNGAIEKFTTTQALTKLDNYLNCYPVADQRRFLRIVSQAKDYQEALIKQGFNSHGVKFISKLLNEEDDLASNAKAHITDQLITITEEKWKEVIGKGTEPFGLMQACASKFEVGLALSESLKHSIPNLFSTSEEKFISRWFALANYLGEDSRVILYKEVRDKICRGESPQKLSRILLSGDEQFIKLADFAHKADEAVRYVVLNLLDVPECYSWMKKNAPILRDWVKNSDKSTRSGVEQKLSALVPANDITPAEVSNSDDTLSVNDIKSIAEAWGLKIRLDMFDSENRSVGSETPKG